MPAKIKFILGSLALTFFILACGNNKDKTTGEKAEEKKQMRFVTTLTW